MVRKLVIDFITNKCALHGWKVNRYNRLDEQISIFMYKSFNVTQFLLNDYSIIITIYINHFHNTMIIDYSDPELYDKLLEYTGLT